MFVLVFGLFSAFSLGVNAYDVSLPSLGFPSFWTSIDSGGTPLTYDYHASKYSEGAYIDSSWDYCSLSDIGYMSRSNYSTANNSQSSYVNWINPLIGYVAVQANLTNSIDFTCSSSSSYEALQANSKYGFFPSLKAGTTYLISCYSPDSIPTTFRFELLGGAKGAFFNSNGYAEFSYTPSEDTNLSDIGFAIVTPSNIGYFSITSLRIVATDNAVVDAINNQTQQADKNHDETIGKLDDQMQQDQQNHDETMEKIDDATDFDDQEQSDLTGAVNGASDQINEKLGILSFGDHVLDQFIGIFDAAAGSPGITLPGFSIEVDGVQHVVWTDQVFDLSTIEDKFGPLMTAVHFATSFLVYAALVMYVQKIFGAIMQDWSDK